MHICIIQYPKEPLGNGLMIIVLKSMDLWWRVKQSNEFYDTNWELLAIQQYGFTTTENKQKDQFTADNPKQPKTCQRSKQ